VKVGQGRGRVGIAQDNSQLVMELQLVPAAFDNLKTLGKPTFVSRLVFDVAKL